MAHSRRLRAGFDGTAGTYHQARPDYPGELIDAVAALTGLTAGARVLEVGCGTGKATIPLAQRGYAITALDIGGRLVREARANLAGYPQIEIILADMETWSPADGRRFDAVVAATSWHWIDPGIRYQRAAELLRPGGHLVFWTAAHVFPVDGDQFFRDLQPIYDEIGMPQPAGEGWPRPGELPDSRAEIEASGAFGDVRVRHIDWGLSYTAEQYIALLSTFSGHIAAGPDQRDRLFTEIRRRLAERPDGQLRRHWGAVLNVATRLDA